MAAPTAPPAIREFDIGGPSGRLRVRRSGPDERAPVRLLFLHGYGDYCGRSAGFLDWLAARGVETWGFDFRGQGLSEGGRGHVRRWDDYLLDLEAVLAALPDDRVPLIAMGHSHGALVLALAVERGRMRAQGCILSAPYFRSSHPVPAPKRVAARILNPILPDLHVPNGLRNEWMSRDPAQVEESRRDPLLIRHATPRWYVGCLSAQREAMANAHLFRLPLLILIGDADRVSDPEAAAEFARAAGSEDIAFRRLPGLRHEILREMEREAVFAEILDWIRDHVPGADLERRP